PPWPSSIRPTTAPATAKRIKRCIIRAQGVGAPAEPVLLVWESPLPGAPDEPVLLVWESQLRTDSDSSHASKRTLRYLVTSHAQEEPPLHSRPNAAPAAGSASHGCRRHSPP